VSPNSPPELPVLVACHRTRHPNALFPSRVTELATRAPCSRRVSPNSLPKLPALLAGSVFVPKTGRPTPKTREKRRIKKIDRALTRIGSWSVSTFGSSVIDELTAPQPR
jgi:hypothetical protein